MKIIFSLIAVTLIIVSAWALLKKSPVPKAAPIVSGAVDEKAPVESEPVIVAKTAPKKEGTPQKPPDNSQFQLVWDLIGDGRKEEAIEHLKEMIRKDPKNDAAMAELGTILAGDSASAAEAIAVLSKALEVNPENDRALADLIFSNTDPKTKGEAIGKIRALLDSNPNSPNLSAGLGRLLVQRGDFQQAAGHLEKASADAKFAETSLSALIDGYKQSGRPQESANAYSRLIAEQERKLEEFSKAGNDVRSFEKRINSNKLGLAAALIEMGQLDNAERLLQQVRERDPQRDDLAHLYKKLSEKRAS